MRCCRCKQPLIEGAAYIAREPTTEKTYGDRVMWALPVYCTGCSDDDESYPTTVFDIEYGTWWCDHVAEDVAKTHRAIGERVARLTDEEAYRLLMGETLACYGTRRCDADNDN